MVEYKQKAKSEPFGVFDDDVLIAVLQKETSWGCVFLTERFPVYLEALESIAAKLRELNKGAKT